MINISEMLKENDFISIIKEKLSDRYKIQQLPAEKRWEKCIDKQKYGQCQNIEIAVCKICKSIGIKAKLIEVIREDFSEIAQKELNDDDEMFGNHYIVKIKSKYYDFGKGSNTIDGIYLLKETPSNEEKYNVTLTNFEKSLMHIDNKDNLVQRDYKYVSSTY